MRIPSLVLVAGLLFPAPIAAHADEKTSPGAAIDRDVLCFVSQGTMSQLSSNQGKDHTINDIASGYYLGIILTRYPNDADFTRALSTARAALNALSNGDQVTTSIDCVKSFGMQFQRVVQAVKPRAI